MNTASDIEQLSAFLRNELSGVDAYARAVELLPMSIHRLALMNSRGSHAIRVTLLRRCILELGGIPADDYVAWRGFTTLLDRVETLEEHAAIAALEEGEDCTHQHYRNGLSLLTASSRPFVSHQLLPEQKRTHATMMELRRYVLRRVRFAHAMAR